MDKKEVKEIVEEVLNEKKSSGMNPLLMANMMGGNIDPVMLMMMGGENSNQANVMFILDLLDKVEINAEENSLIKSVILSKLGVRPHIMMFLDFINNLDEELVMKLTGTISELLQLPDEDTGYIHDLILPLSGNPFYDTAGIIGKIIDIIKESKVDIDGVNERLAAYDLSIRSKEEFEDLLSSFGPVEKISIMLNIDEEYRDEEMIRKFRDKMKEFDTVVDDFAIFIEVVLKEIGFNDFDLDSILGNSDELPLKTGNVDVLRAIEYIIEGQKLIMKMQVDQNRDDMIETLKPSLDAKVEMILQKLAE